ncbi:MAG: hypothetical protein MUP24_07280 [Gillisia sp.]|nr:hypothetical protein [Gillisia sp.]
MDTIKTYLLASLIILLFANCSNDNGRSISNIKNSSFDKGGISKGNNSPNSIIYEDNVDVLLVSMFYGKSIEEIQKALGWEDPKMQETTDLLIENGMLTENNGVYTPTVFVLPLKEGIALKKESNLIANEISDSIVAILDEFKELHKKMDISKQVSFNDLSFFYLSDILLDMGQIGNVESLFLKKERPMRNGKNYYFAIMEKDTTKKEEAFGIYGNLGLHNNDSIYIGVYGNTRAQEAGWDDYKNKEVYSFSKNDYSILFNQFNKKFTPTLINILEKNNAEFLKLFNEYGYSGKISFEEFFIWYYHLIYTEATNELIKKKVIKKPGSGLFYYQIDISGA